MARIDWQIEGESFGVCNCDYACPCQFEGLPNYGGCEGFDAFRIDKGHFGDIRLDGLKAVTIYAWPGAIFEGKGKMQIIIDASATPEQRTAMTAILTGEETDEAATHWWVYYAMADTRYPVQFAPISFEVDVDARKARLNIPALLESEGRPIISPSTGGEHRVRIDMPAGMEFSQAEIGSATTKAFGNVPLAITDRYSQFYRLRQSGKGIPR